MKKTAHTKRSARLLRCLYCPMEFTKGSGEHVILSALGGRKESRSACCQACNKRLGDEVDKPLAEALRFVCNLLSITTGRGKAAPTIRRVDSGRGYNLDLRPGMTPRVSNARVESTDLPGGKVHVRIRARDEEEFKRLFAAQLERFGGSASVEVTSSKRVRHYADPVQFSLALGGPLHLRSLAKMMLNYLCTLVAPARVRSGTFVPLVDFINSGTPLPVGSINHDYVNAFPTTAPRASFEHRLFIFAVPAEKCVLSLLELFGALRFSAVLSEAWDGPEVASVYIVDPVTGTQRDEHAERPAGLTKASVLGRVYKNEEGGQTVDRLLQEASEEQARAFREQLIEETLVENWGTEGAIITEEKFRSAAEALARRYIEWANRIETEEPFTVGVPAKSPGPPTGKDQGG